MFPGGHIPVGSPDMGEHDGDSGRMRTPPRRHSAHFSGNVSNGCCGAEGNHRYRVIEHHT